MSRAPLPRILAVAAVTLALVVSALGAVAPATAEETEGTEATGEVGLRRPAVIKINVGRRAGKVDSSLLGINHRYTRNGYGLWDEAQNRPDPTVVRHIRRAGVTSLRYPGGTTATMYHWKDAIGPVKNRDCQIEGHGHHATEGFKSLRKKLAYGPDEFMRVIDATGAAPLIMMPFVTQDPKDAADWVEYMNARVGTNPGGGTAWARVRARNGHRAPYNVRRWEVGNESHVAPTRYGFSPNPYKAVQQYANGGLRSIRGEALGRRCAHPGKGVPSNGRKNQEFEVIFTPAKIRQVTVAGRRWREVGNVDNFGPLAKVYSVRGKSGVVTFGDGHRRPNGTLVGHGKVPAKGTTVRADYRNPYSGFFDFARKMHRVDKSIKVCATWGTPLFADAARARRYDCQSAHPLTNFSSRPVHEWKNALEGHDRMMLGLGHRQADVKAIMRGLPPRTPLLLTEFQAIHGYARAFPGWSASVSNAVYMASQWATWLRLGLRWGNGGDLLGRGIGSVFGSPQKYAFSVEAAAREAIRPMFRSGGRVVSTQVRRNPKRAPQLANAGAYKALTVVASRGKRGELWLFVVNKLPRTRVRAQVQIHGMRVQRKAAVRRVVGGSFREYNPPGQPPRVRMLTSSRRVGKAGFAATFPAHSVTVLRMPRR